MPVLLTPAVWAGQALPPTRGCLNTSQVLEAAGAWGPRGPRPERPRGRGHLLCWPRHPLLGEAFPAAAPQLAPFVCLHSTGQRLARPGPARRSRPRPRLGQRVPGWDLSALMPLCPGPTRGTHAGPERPV